MNVKPDIVKALIDHERRLKQLERFWADDQQRFENIDAKLFANPDGYLVASMPIVVFVVFCAGITLGLVL